MIEQLKKDIAREKIEVFLEHMAQLGLKNEEVLELMGRFMKGEKE